MSNSNQATSLNSGFVQSGGSTPYQTPMSPYGQPPHWQGT